MMAPVQAELPYRAGVPRLGGASPYLSRPSDLQRFERCGQRFEKRLHRLDGFISHVRDAKCLALDLSIAAVDLESVFVPNSFCERCHINLPIVFDTGQRDRSIAFLGEELESVGIHPFVNEAIGLPMALKPIFETFAENIFELRPQRIDVRNRRSARRHEFFSVFLEFEADQNSTRDH